jgi:hypothetical protein
MQAFRFPRTAIALMVATFLTILGAIGLAAEMARTVQAGLGVPTLPSMWWSALPIRFVLMFLFLWVVGAVGYGILFALRWSGVHRLSNTVTWPQTRQ